MFPNVIIEAMSYGNTFIATNTTGVPETAKKGEGFICECGDINCFVDKIELLIQEKNADVKSLKDYIFDKFKANKFEDLTNEQSDIIIAMLEKKKKANNDGK